MEQPISLPMAAVNLERSLDRLVTALEAAGRELRRARIEYQSVLDAARKASRRPSLPPAFDCLTRQERRIALLVAAGSSDAEVAGVAHISVHTVKTQMKSVLRKLRLHSRWQLGQALADPSASDFLADPTTFTTEGDGEPRAAQAV